MKKNLRIAVLTGGGDCPGLNAAIRAVAKHAILEYGAEVIGIEDGFDGVIHNRHRKLAYDNVSGILTLGGTILGASNIANPYRYARKRDGKLEFEDVSKSSIANIKNLGIDCLVCVGGDGTLGIAYKLFKDGVPVVGVPKTIDNDLIGTDVTIGFNSAVSIATEGIDRVHTTAQSHHRVMIVEVMGRNAGWIALHSGVAGGGDVVLIPEIPYDIEVIVKKVNERNARGRHSTVVVVAEGAKQKDGKTAVQRIVESSPEPIRYGGISFVLESLIEKATGIESRSVVLGHLQRGGTPTPYDRVLATRVATRAVDLAVNGRYGNMVGVRGNLLVEVPLEEVARGQKTIPPDDPLLQAARYVGTCFGDY